MRKLTLTQFRNYLELTLAPVAGINCFTGSNGSGKTNLLDALHFIALTRSFRHSQDSMAVQEGATFFLIQAEVMRDGYERQVQCNFAKGRGKRILVNNAALTRYSEHLGAIPLVCVLPDDTALINEAAEERRTLMDMLLSQYDPGYLHHLIHYKRLLEQRNALLKQFAEHNTFDREQLELWNLQIVPHGIALLERRLAFLEEFRPVFERYYRRIADTREVPALAYQATIPASDLSAWLDAFARSESRDLALARTNVGVHRDDLVFSINGTSVRNFGSQGQQKTFVVALKLAEYELLQAHTGIAPLLLLDDIFDKLDEHRLRAIARILEHEIDGQVFITDTSQERLREIFGKSSRRPVAFFGVTHGEVHATT